MMDGKKVWEQMKPALTTIALQSARLVLNELVKVVTQEINNKSLKGCSSPTYSNGNGTGDYTGTYTHTTS